MPVKLEDRPIGQVREETIDKLIINYSHGVISAEAFERRLDQATYCDVHQELVELVADLPMEADTQYARYKDNQLGPQYQAASSADSDSERMLCILSSDERKGKWVVPRRIVLYNVLGSVDLDFSEAVFTHQQVTIEIKGLLNSTEIWVPEDINVSTRMAGVLSSTENKAPSMGGRQAPQITIEGFSLLGSLSIKERKTLREKWVAFANKIKAALNE